MNKFKCERCGAENEAGSIICVHCSKKFSVDLLEDMTIEQKVNFLVGQYRNNENQNEDENENEKFEKPLALLAVPEEHASILQEVFDAAREFGDSDLAGLIAGTLGFASDKADRVLDMLRFFIGSIGSVKDLFDGE